MSAIIAKLMNSTVGTSSTKALDAILKTDNTAIANNAADRLYNAINNSVKLVGSDETILAYDGGWATYTPSNSKFSGRQTSSYMTFGKSGVVRFKTVQKGSRSDATHTFYLIICNSSGTEIGRTEVSLGMDAVAEISCEINVTAGTKYQVKLECYNTSTSGTLSAKVSACATPVVFGVTASVTT